MSELRTVCLGNANPKQYLKEIPKPPEDASIEDVREFVGKRINPEKLKAYEGKKDERQILLGINEHILDPDPRPWDGPKCRTKIKFSPDSLLSECISEAKRIWRKHGNGMPGWIAGTDETLVNALAAEFGIKEVREYMEDGK